VCSKQVALSVFPEIKLAHSPKRATSRGNKRGPEDALQEHSSILQRVFQNTFRIELLRLECSSKVLVAHPEVTSALNRRGATEIRNLGWLLLEDHGRPTNSLPFEGNTHFDPVGNLDERDAAIHSVLFAVESHSPRNGPRA